MTYRIASQFRAELKRLGFTAYRDDPTIYAKAIDAERTVDVVFFRDGLHRARNWMNGVNSTRPTNFSDVPTMLSAIERESTRTDHAHSEKDLGVPTDVLSEALDALEGLAQYIGGWDMPADHPCGHARDILAKHGRPKQTDEMRRQRNASGFQG